MPVFAAPCRPTCAYIKRMMELIPLRDRSPVRDRFSLPLPDDFRADDMLRFHGRDRESPIERVEGRGLRRAVRIGGRAMLLSLAFRAERVECRIDTDAAGGARAGVQRTSPRSVTVDARRIVRRLLGLDLDTAAFERRAARDSRLGPYVRRRRGLRIPQTSNVFEGLVWAIVGQQVNLSFAFRLRRRVIELAGDRLADGMMAHPTPEGIARLDYDDLTKRQFSRRKAEYLIDAARLIASGRLDIEAFPDRPTGEVEADLLAVRGIGPWTAQYVMMRSCGFADCVPIGDAGLIAALSRLYGLRKRPDAAKTLRLLRPFAPHRSLATFHFWMTLGEPA